MRKHLILNLIFLVLTIAGNGNNSHGQVADSTDISSDTLNRSCSILVTATGTALYAEGIPGLYVLWYKDYPQSSYHIFDDNDK